MKPHQKQICCEICETEAPKYRCPNCKIQYCTVACYKAHKEKACNLAVGHNEEHERENAVVSTIGRTEDSEDESTEDKVPAEKLKKLDESHALKQMLENPHLRSIMIGLVESRDPGRQMEAAMQEPLFLELADECLDIIKDENSLPKG